MTDEERVTMLEETLYFFTRYRSAMAKGAMADSHLEALSGFDDAAFDNRISTIEWAIRRTDLDFQSIMPTLPERATVVAWLEIALRDIRALKATRTS
jgi:hypothetical protein